MSRTILFSHIPKTGGTTLRIILNRVYGEDRVYFIKSKDIKGSYEIFMNMSLDERSQFRVIAGHGAELFTGMIDNPFRLTILREPVSLFNSQYHFLRVSPFSHFYKEVRAMNNIEDYLDFAIEMGQDNLLTRYLSGSMNWLINPELEIPDLDMEGSILLDRAKKNLKSYNAVIDLESFDKGIYALKKMLHWSFIPVYRPSNLNVEKQKEGNLSAAFLSRLIEVLRFDIELYKTFLEKNFNIAEHVKSSSVKYNLFSFRQLCAARLATILGRR